MLNLFLKIIRNKSCLFIILLCVYCVKRFVIGFVLQSALCNILNVKYVSNYLCINLTQNVLLKIVHAQSALLI